MRWIAITLLVINAAYFAWQQYDATYSVIDGATQHTTEHELRLAAEVIAPSSVDVDSIDVPQSQVDGQQSAPSAPVAHESAIATGRATPRACYSIGPFLIVNDVSNIAKIFEEVDGIATQQRAASERNRPDYWVFIPPLESLQAARSVVRDLQQRQIRDVLIISEGVKANAISAGVYNTEAQAQTRRDSIRALGYQAEIDPLYRTQPQYWLDIELMKAQTIPVKLWRKVTKSFPAITKSERPCE